MNPAMRTTFVAFVVAFVCVNAMQEYQSRIPNGNNVAVNGRDWPGVGHVASSGGGERNQFGIDFANAGHQWTSALCEMDSDGDGWSNGIELGAPCDWKAGDVPSRTTDISHPGLNTSFPSAISQPPSPTSVEPTTPEPQQQAPRSVCTTRSPQNGSALTSVSGEIRSDADGAGPSPYSANENCVWTITCSPREFSAINISLIFNTSVQRDTVTLVGSDGKALMTKSGVGSDAVVQAMTSVAVHFKSSSFIASVAGGFTLMYQCVRQQQQGSGDPPTEAPQHGGWYPTPTMTVVASEAPSNAPNDDPSTSDSPAQGTEAPAADPSSGGDATSDAPTDAGSMDPQSTDATTDDPAPSSTAPSDHHGTTHTPAETTMAPATSFGTTPELTTSTGQTPAAPLTTTSATSAAPATPTPGMPTPQPTNSVPSTPAPQTPSSAHVCSATNNGTTLNAASGTIRSDSDGAEGGVTARANERCVWWIQCPGTATARISFVFTTSLKSAFDRIAVADSRGIELVVLTGSAASSSSQTSVMSSSATIAFTTGAAAGSGGFTAQFECVAPTTAEVSAARTSLFALADGASTPSPNMTAVLRAGSDLLTTNAVADGQLVVEALEKIAAPTIPQAERQQLVSLVAAAVTATTANSACTASCVSDVRHRTLQITQQLAVVPSAAGGATLSAGAAKGLVEAVASFAPDAETGASIEKIAVSLSLSADVSQPASVPSVNHRYAIGVARLPASAIGTQQQVVVANATRVTLPTSTRLQASTAAVATPAIAVVELNTNVFGTAGLDDSGASAAIESAVVHVQLSNSNGAKLTITDLDTPIKIEVTVNEAAAKRIADGQVKAVCNYLAASGNWSRDGVTTEAYDPATRRATCATTHLSKFGVSLALATAGGDGGGGGGGGLSTNSGMAFIFLGAILVVVGIAAVLYFTNRKKREAASRAAQGAAFESEGLQVPMVSNFSHQLQQNQKGASYNPLLHTPNHHAA